MSTYVTINLRTPEARARFAAAAAAAGESMSAFGYPALMELIDTPSGAEGRLDAVAQPFRSNIVGTVTNPTPPTPPPPGPGTGWDDTTPGMVTGAISATRLRQTFGTRVFPTYTGKVYGELVISDTTRRTAARNWLTGLNPGFITHKLVPGMSTAVLNFIADMSTAGIPSVLTVGEPFKTYTDAQWNQMMGYLTGTLAGHVQMVTGQNEVNHVRGTGTLPTNWATIAGNHQHRLWTEVNGSGGVNATLAAAGKPAIKVGTPCLWSGDIAVHDADLNTLAPLVTGYCDAIVFHLYPRGGEPTWNLNHFVDEYQTKYGSSLPIWCTEAGYFTAPNYTGGAANITEASQAIYLVKLVLEYALRGCKVGQFEFLNDPDPTGANREANLGLLNVGSSSVSSLLWSAKPAYAPLQALTGLTGGTTGSTSITVSGTGIQHLVVNHSGGNRVFLWRRGDIENASHQAINLSPTTVTATVTAGGTTYTPSVGRTVVTLDV